MKRVTLQDIATQMNISRTTVHRALQGKEGISEELREAIQARAAKMGYTANYIASSLKRKTIRLAVVLPQREGSGRYYHKYICDAVDAFQEDAKSLNVDIAYYFCMDGQQEQVQILDQLFRNGNSEIHGLLLVPSSSDENLRVAVERFSYIHIPVVLIDTDLESTHRLCCVAPHDHQIGRLGAEILTLMAQRPGKILVAGGDPLNAAHTHNLLGFTEYLEENRKPFTVVTVEGFGDYWQCYRQSLQILQNDPEVSAFYSVTARDTIPLAQAVIDSGLQGKLRGVGSDLFAESAALLREDVLQALIHKNAYEKGQAGFQILFQYVVKNILPKTDKVAVPVGIIMKNNLDFFLNRL